MGGNPQYVLGESMELREELEELRIEPNSTKDDASYLEKCLAFQYSQVGQLQRVAFFDKLNMEVIKSAAFMNLLNSDLADKLKMATSYREPLLAGRETLTAPAMQVIAESLINIARDANEILKFTELNITAVRKILKKFNKGFETLRNQ